MINPAKMFFSVSHSTDESMFTMTIMMEDGSKVLKADISEVLKEYINMLDHEVQQLENKANSVHGEAALGEDDSSGATDNYIAGGEAPELPPSFDKVCETIV